MKKTKKLETLANAAFVDSNRQLTEDIMREFFQQSEILPSHIFKVVFRNNLFDVLFSRTTETESHISIREKLTKDEGINYSIYRFECVILSESEVIISDKHLMLQLLKHGIPKSLVDKVDRITDRIDLTSLEPPSAKIDLRKCIFDCVSVAFEHAAQHPEELIIWGNASPIEKYTDRDKQELPTAEDFLKEIWKSWLQSGDITQAHVRRSDPKLMTALDNQFRGRRDELAKLIPPKSSESDKRLNDALGYVPQGEERRHALSNLAKGYKPRKRKL